jgi:flagellar hook-basal body complex protein FliE
MSFMDSIGGQFTDLASQGLMDPGSFDLGNIAEFAGEAAVQVGVAYATAQFGPVGGAVAQSAASALTGGGQQSIGDMKPSDFASFLTDALGQLSDAAQGQPQTVGEMTTSEFKDLLSGVVDQLQNSGEEKVGDMSQKDFIDALKDVVSQIGRDGQKETKKGGEGKGEAGASGEAGEAGAAGGASEAGGGSGASLRDLAEALGKAVSDRVAAAKEKVSALTADSDQGQILEATSEVGAAGFLATSAGGAMQSAIQGTNELARKG